MVTADPPDRDVPETACGTVVEVVVEVLVDVDDFEVLDVVAVVEVADEILRYQA